MAPVVPKGLQLVMPRNTQGFLAKGKSYEMPHSKDFLLRRLPYFKLQPTALIAMH